MEENTVVRLPGPGASVADDPLQEVLRSGASKMLWQVIEAEVEAFVAAHAELEDAHRRRRVVRNGHAPEGRSRLALARSPYAGRSHRRLRREERPKMSRDPAGELRPTSQRFDLQQAPVTFAAPTKRGYSSKTAHQCWCACLEALPGATSPSIPSQLGDVG